MDFHEYTDINEVPISWRTYKSARLNLSQINNILRDAHENEITTTEEGITIPDYGGAKQRFAEKHEIREGFWVREVE